LEAEIEKAIKETALEAFRIMRCRDYARVDFRLRDREAYVLEVNPNPCINPEGSGFILAGNAAGMSYAEIILAILECSIKDRGRMTTPLL
jgi:D-alanine-D-alanine ligase